MSRASIAVLVVLAAVAATLAVAGCAGGGSPHTAAPAATVAAAGVPSAAPATAATTGGSVSAFCQALRAADDISNSPSVSVDPAHGLPLIKAADARLVAAAPADIAGPVRLLYAAVERVIQHGGTDAAFSQYYVSDPQVLQAQGAVNSYVAKQCAPSGVPAPPTT